MRRIIITLIAAVALSFGAYCQQSEDNSGAGLLLLLLAGQNSQTTSGFFISVPDGVAK